MTFANHPERQFMQYLRGAGWIEQQRQGPTNEVYFRLTEKGWKPRNPPSRRVEHR